LQGISTLLLDAAYVVEEPGAFNEVGFADSGDGCVDFVIKRNKYVILVD
jgi:hypothetical protein